MEDAIENEREQLFDLNIGDGGAVEYELPPDVPDNYLNKDYATTVDNENDYVNNFASRRTTTSRRASDDQAEEISMDFGAESHNSHGVLKPKEGAHFDILDGNVVLCNDRVNGPHPSVSTEFISLGPDLVNATLSGKIALHLIVGSMNAGKSSLSEELVDPGRLISYLHKDEVLQPFESLFEIDSSVVGTTIRPSGVGFFSRIFINNGVDHFVVDTPGLQDDNMSIADLIGRFKGQTQQHNNEENSKFRHYWPHKEIISSDTFDKDKFNRNTSRKISDLTSDKGIKYAKEGNADAMYLQSLSSSFPDGSNVASINICLSKITSLSDKEDVHLKSTLKMFSEQITKIGAVNILVTKEVDGIASFFCSGGVTSQEAGFNSNMSQFKTQMYLIFEKKVNNFMLKVRQYVGEVIHGDGEIVNIRLYFINRQVAAGNEQKHRAIFALSQRSEWFKDNVLQSGSGISYAALPARIMRKPGELERDHRECVKVNQLIMSDLLTSINDTLSGMKSEIAIHLKEFKALSTDVKLRCSCLRATWKIIDNLADREPLILVKIGDPQGGKNKCGYYCMLATKCLRSINSELPKSSQINLRSVLQKMQFYNGSLEYHGSADGSSGTMSFNFAEDEVSKPNQVTNFIKNCETVQCTGLGGAIPFGYSVKNRGTVLVIEPSARITAHFIANNVTIRCKHHELGSLEQLINNGPGSEQTRITDNLRSLSNGLVSIDAENRKDFSSLLSQLQGVNKGLEAVGEILSSVRNKRQEEVDDLYNEIATLKNRMKGIQILMKKREPGRSKVTAYKTFVDRLIGSIKNSNNDNSGARQLTKDPKKPNSRNVVPDRNSKESFTLDGDGLEIRLESAVSIEDKNSQERDEANLKLRLIELGHREEDLVKVLVVSGYKTQYLPNFLAELLTAELGSIVSQIKLFIGSIRSKLSEKILTTLEDLKQYVRMNTENRVWSNPEIPREITDWMSSQLAHDRGSNSSYQDKIRFENAGKTTSYLSAVNGSGTLDSTLSEMEKSIWASGLFTEGELAGGENVFKRTRPECRIGIGAASESVVTGPRGGSTTTINEEIVPNQVVVTIIDNIKTLVMSAREVKASLIIELDEYLLLCLTFIKLMGNSAYSANVTHLSNNLGALIRDIKEEKRQWDIFLSNVEMLDSKLQSPEPVISDDCFSGPPIVV